MRYQIAPSILFKSTNDKLIAVSEEAEDEFCIYEFEDSGRILCELLRQGASKADLQNLLQTEYEVSEAQAAADVDEFIASLLETKIIIEKA
jgi:hypothetical protein